MNDHEFEQALADYLGGEMSVDRQAAFRRAIESNADRHALVSELADARDRLRTGLPTISATRPRRSFRVVGAVAAMIALAFVAGYATGQAQPSNAPAAPGNSVVMRESHAQLARRYVQVSKSHPNASLFARRLLLAAR